jgi:hypothetical protein
MKATIAISRLIGSEGTKIAHRVAETLGYTVVNRNVLEGIFRQYGLAKFGELYTSSPNLWDLADAKNLEIVSMLNETMEALANRRIPVSILHRSLIDLLLDISGPCHKFSEVCWH